MNFSKVFFVSSFIQQDGHKFSNALRTIFINYPVPVDVNTGWAFIKMVKIVKYLCTFQLRID